MRGTGSPALTVALVGPDIRHLDTGGGTAAVSLRIVEAFRSDPGVTVIPVRNYYSFNIVRRVSAAVGAVLTVLRTAHSIDVVHIQVTGGLSIERDLLLVEAARARGIPVVLQFHGAGQAEDYAQGSTFHRSCYRRLLRAGTEIAVLGEHAQAWVASICAAASTRVIANCVDVDPAVQLLGDVPTVCFAGRLGQRKGVFDLLEALDQIGREGLHFRAFLAGDGEVDAVRELVRQRSSLRDRVAVFGWMSRSDVLDRIRQSWVLALPSYAEGMPLSILDAMACGRAVVATAVNEVDQLVADGESGFLIQPGDVSGLARALANVLSDPVQTSRMGQAGWLAAKERFSPDVMLAKLYAIWTSAAGAQHRR